MSDKKDRMPEEDVARALKRMAKEDVTYVLNALENDDGADGAKVLSQMADFLEVRQHAEGTGWPSVSLEDLDVLAYLIQRLIDLKWDRDCDGDCPVLFSLLNRNTHQQGFYQPLPQLHAIGGNKAELVKALQVALANASTAATEVNLVIQELQWLGWGKVGDSE